MSWHLIGYTPWEEKNVTVSDVTYLGVIANYFLGASGDIIDPPSIYTTLPNGTNAVLCPGSKATNLEDGREFRLLDNGTWSPQPSSDLSQYGTKEYIVDALGNLRPWAIAPTYSASETLQKIWTQVDLYGDAELNVTTQPIEITSSQVSDISTTIGDAITAFQTDTADHRYLRIGTGTAVSNGTDLNTLKTLGKYRNANASNGCRNMPLEVAGRPFTITVENMYGNARYKQTLWLGQSLVVDRWYYRIMTNDTDWSDWYKVEGTAVATDVPTP